MASYPPLSSVVRLLRGLSRLDESVFFCLLAGGGGGVFSFPFRAPPLLEARRGRRRRRPSAQSYSPLDERPALRAIGSFLTPSLTYLRLRWYRVDLDRAHCR